MQWQRRRVGVKGGRVSGRSIVSPSGARPVAFPPLSSTIWCTGAHHGRIQEDALEAGECQATLVPYLQAAYFGRFLEEHDSRSHRGAHTPRRPQTVPCVLRYTARRELQVYFPGPAHPAVVYMMATFLRTWLRRGSKRSFRASKAYLL